VGLAGDGAVQGEAVTIGGERLGCRVGPGEGRVLEGEGSSADALSCRDAVANGGGVQMIQRVSGLQVKPWLFGVCDQRSSRESLRTMRRMRQLSRRSRVCASGAPTGWNRGPFCSSV